MQINVTHAQHTYVYVACAGCRDCAYRFFRLPLDNCTTGVCFHSQRTNTAADAAVVDAAALVIVHFLVQMRRKPATEKDKDFPTSQFSLEGSTVQLILDHKRKHVVEVCEYNFHSDVLFQFTPC